MFDRVRRNLSKRLDPLGSWVDAHAEHFVRLVVDRKTRTAVAWIVALTTAAVVLHGAWPSFNDDKRPDGNLGHTTIDFGGQWLMGAMLVHGHGAHLYNRNYQREVLLAAYPRDREDPKAERGDADKLMSYFMGEDRRRSAEVVGSFLVPLAASDPLQASAWAAACDAQWTPDALAEATKPVVGGPLYPPINALLYVPLGVLSPPAAYRVNQVCNVIWAWVAALGVYYLTRGRIWVSVALILIVLYPGFKGSICLGQNAALTLAVLIWGWALIARDRPIAGGLVWGLLAFKPVWALAFFLVPFVTLRGRTCAAMIVAGICLAALTLPLVGWRPWLDWFEVGRLATAVYKADYNWIYLSRDLLGIPRRWLVDFSLAYPERDNWRAAVASWSLFVACLLPTVVLAWLRPRQARAATGLPAGFLLLGAWLSCFHFMYYDVLLSALPLFVLLAEPHKYLEPILLAVVPLPPGKAAGDFEGYYAPWPADRRPAPAPLLRPKYRQLWVLNRMVPNVLLLLLLIEHCEPHLGLSVSVSGYLWEGSIDQAVRTHDQTHFMLQPWDTYTVMFLWLWCGLQWLRLPSARRRPWIT